LDGVKRIFGRARRGVYMFLAAGRKEEQGKRPKAKGKRQKYAS
jgi:hypothetical protein